MHFAQPPHLSKDKMYQNFKPKSRKKNVHFAQIYLDNMHKKAGVAAHFIGYFLGLCFVNFIVYSSPL